MSSGKHVMMYNFLEKRVDRVFSIDNIEEAKHYVPQDAAVLEQLEAYVAAGNTLIEALTFAIQDYYDTVYEVLADWYKEGDKNHE